MGKTTVARKGTVVLILQVQCTEKLKQNIDTVQSET